MAAPTATPQQPVSAQVVGNAFVTQYYHILHQSPGLVHRFYQDISKLGRPEEDGTMSITTTMDAINTKILSLNYDEFRAEIKSVDAQESLDGGVNVLVTGYLTGKDNIVRNFTQSFFLAPQDKGYFVLNDMFRYMETAINNQANNAPPTEDVEAPAIPEQVPKSVPVVEDNVHVAEEVAAVVEEAEGEVVFNPPPPENVEVADVAVEAEVEEEPVAEVVDEVQEASQLVVESKTKIEEVVPKKSYASIVMDLKQSDVPFSSPPPVIRKPQPRVQEQQQHVNNNNGQAVGSVAESALAPNNVDAVENGIHEEEADGYSIYIKGLPMSATPAMLDEEFKKFGAIKTNGIQVRSNRQQGFCFGFVEFETPEAVQKAIEASPVAIGGRNSVVEEKRSTSSKGGARGRFTMGRGAGGFRNEGMRGGPARGNSFGAGGGNGSGSGSGSGRGGYNNNNRGEFGGGSGSGRNDYGNRGGGRAAAGGGAPPPPNRGGGGDRMNRGMAVNGTAKNMAPRVPATA